MDWKQFIAGVVSSIAWPAVALTFLFLFRAELAKIVQRIAHFKYKDLEMDFDKVKQTAEELQLEKRKERRALESPALNSLEDQILDTVERAPSAAILLSWSGLESAIAAAVARLGISPDSPSACFPMANVAMLAKNGRLSKTHERLLLEMRILRNKIIHEHESMPSVSEEQAFNYATTAIELMRHFESYQPID